MGSDKHVEAERMRSKGVVVGVIGRRIEDLLRSTKTRYPSIRAAYTFDLITGQDLLGLQH